MKRTFQNLMLAALSALTLAACTTNPAKPDPAPVVQKSTTDLLLEIRKAELELERTEQMAWLKFAVESGSDYVKGFVMGKAGGSPRASAGGASTAQTILQAQAQADEVALRREQLADKNSGWNRGLQLFDRGAQLFMFSKGLSFQQWQIGETNAQNRFNLSTVRGAQADGFTAGSGATLSGVNAGHNTTLGGIGAGAAAAATGASAVIRSQAAAAPAETTPE